MTKFINTFISVLFLLSVHVVYAKTQELNFFIVNGESFSAFERDTEYDSAGDWKQLTPILNMEIRDEPVFVEAVIEEMDIPLSIPQTAEYIFFAHQENGQWRRLAKHQIEEDKLQLTLSKSGNYSVFCQFTQENIELPEHFRLDLNPFMLISSSYEWNATFASLQHYLENHFQNNVLKFSYNPGLNAEQNRQNLHNALQMIQEQWGRVYPILFLHEDAEFMAYEQIFHPEYMHEFPKIMVFRHEEPASKMYDQIEYTLEKYVSMRQKVFEVDWYYFASDSVSTFHWAHYHPCSKPLWEWDETDFTRQIEPILKTDYSFSINEKLRYLNLALTEQKWQEWNTFGKNEFLLQYSSEQWEVWQKTIQNLLLSLPRNSVVCTADDAFYYAAQDSINANRLEVIHQSLLMYPAYRAYWQKRYVPLELAYFEGNQVELGENLPVAFFTPGAKTVSALTPLGFFNVHPEQLDDELKANVWVQLANLENIPLEKLPQIEKSKWFQLKDYIINLQEQSLNKEQKRLLKRWEEKLESLGK